MKCQKVREQMIAYQDGEMTPSARVLIQEHLADCAGCREEMAALTVLQRRVGHSLQAWAGQAAPSPQAWSRLQARLAREVRPSPSWLPAWLRRPAPGVRRGRSIVLRGRGVTMKRAIICVLIAILVAALAVVAFVPSVRAQLGQLLGAWYVFGSPGGEVMVSVSGVSWEFTPLNPTYMPAELRGYGCPYGELGGDDHIVHHYDLSDTQSAATRVYGRVYGSAGYDHIVRHYYCLRDDSPFVLITETLAPAGQSLPAGRAVTIQGQPGVLVTDLQGVFRPGSKGLPEEARVGDPTIAYTDGRRLTWDVGNTRVEMLSTLSEEEMFKVAESLVPVELQEEFSP